VARCPTGKHHAVAGPLGSGMRRDTEVEDPTPIVRQHQEDIQDLEPDRRHREEVDRDHGFDVILQKGAPSLGGRPAMTYHVLADAGLADVDAELQQFAVDARCSPQRILPAHRADQIADLFGHGRPPRLTVPDLPRPKKSEALPMPGNDGFRLHDEEGGSPIGPSLGQPCPEKAISGGQFRPLHRALEHAELVTQSEDLDLEGCSAAERSPKGREERSKHGGGRE
jgi:hypothetical protein